MKRFLATLTGFGVFFVCVAAPAQELRKLEFRMQPGMSLNYTLHAETKSDYVSYKPSGKDTRAHYFRSDMKLFLRCVKVSPEGVTHVEIAYPDFSMETSLTQGGQTSKIVSDPTGAKAYVDGKLEESVTWDVIEKRGAPSLAKLLSSIIQVTLDKRGNVLDVKLPSGVGQHLPGADVKQFFRQQVILPVMPVSPGAEWSETTETEVSRGPGPLGGKIVIDETTYQYQKNETVMGRECARIRVTTKSKPKEEIPNLNKFTQTKEGWSLVDLENGQLVQSEMKLFQEVEGTPGGTRTGVKTTGVVRTNLVPPSAPIETSAEEKPPVETK